MKLNELIKEFTVHVTNEENDLLDKINEPCYYESFTEREQFVIENLFRKSLLTKVHNKGNVMVVPNEKS
jgi:hypothetical protein